jgi:hypothetical protein
MGVGTGGYAMMASSVSSSIGKATAGYYAGKVRGAGLRFRGAVDDENALLADYAARDAEDRGRTKEKEHLRKTKQFIGTQRAQMGASGVAVNAGTNTDVVADSARGGAQDALNIRRDSIMEAWGFKSKASGFRSNARMNRMAADDAEMAGAIGAGTSLITGAQKTAWYGYQSKVFR